MSSPSHKRVVSPTQKALNLWGIVLTVWAVYRASIGSASPLVFDEFIFKPLLFLFPVLYYVRHYEHKSLEHGLWLHLKTWKTDLLYGLMISILLLAYFVFIAMTRKVIQWSDVPLYLAIAFAMAITEETLSRGFVASRIYDETHSLFKTLVQSSILHLFLRIPRVMTTAYLFGDKLLYAFAAEILMSFVVTWVFLLRKSLFAAIAVRTAYVFVLLNLLK